jgi:outer membrane protein, multidrug efflux system
MVRNMPLRSLLSLCAFVPPWSIRPAAPNVLTRRASVLAAATLIYLLAGCAVGPKYQAPRTETAASFANGAQTNLASGEVAIEWWRGFNDAQLNRLVNSALAANPDLRVATARIREARALYNGSTADGVPIGYARAGYTESVSSKDAVPAAATRRQREMRLFNVGFDATWELDVFGRVSREVEATSANLAAVIADYQDVKISLISEVARNYFELRGEQNQLAVARQNAENQKQTLDLTTAKFQAGRATELDTARAQALLTQTLAAIPPLEGVITHTMYRLSVLTGRQPSALESELSQPAPIPALPDLVNIGDPAGLLRRRPDIRAAERALAVATARIGVETADLFPRVTFKGSLGWTAARIVAIGESGSDAYSFGPQITWAALDLGHVRARISAAHARADGELAVFEKTVLSALEETEDALVDFGHEQARRDYLADSVRSAKQASDLARQRYDGGVSDFLPVLDAERTQLQVEAQLAQSQTRTATSLVAIYKALGGGWEVKPLPPQ